VWFVDAVLPGLVARCPEVRVVVAGAGPARRALDEAAARSAGRVECVGQVSEARKWELYAACDAVVMPNRPQSGDVEGFGLVALEAGIGGAALFAADVEGLRDAVTDGCNGRLLPAGDAAYLKEVNRRLNAILENRLDSGASKAG